MNERRVLDRKLLTYFSRVMDRNNNLLLGYLVDMTTGGAMIIGNIPLKVDSTFELRIDLPESYNTKNQLEFDAKAVWSRPDPDPELYRTGLKLIDVEPADMVILQRLIMDYGLNQG